MMGIGLGSTLTAGPALVGQAPERDDAAATPATARPFDRAISRWADRFLARFPNGVLVRLTSAAIVWPRGIRPIFVDLGAALEGASQRAADAAFARWREAAPGAHLALQVSQSTLDAWGVGDEHRLPCVFHEVWLIESCTHASLRLAEARGSLVRTMAARLRNVGARGPQERLLLVSVGTRRRDRPDCVPGAGCYSCTGCSGKT